MAKQSDLEGVRFGKLTVLEKTEQRRNGYIVWRCRCDCGGEIQTDTRRLVRGTIKDCGCTPKVNARNGSTAENLSGQKFGKLRVLYKTANYKGRTCWMCQCDCGRKKAVTSHDLKSGKCKSCGCLAYDRSALRVDLTGQQFGRLTALYPTERRDSKGSVYWHCVCTCGNEKEVTESGLVFGNYRSCGCLKQENQKNISKKLHRVDGTCIEILERRKHRCDNTSGFRGVYRMKNGKYRVDIGFKGRRFYLGSFEEFEDAVKVRLDAEKAVHEGFLKAYYQWKENAGEDPNWEEENPLVFEVEKVNGTLEIGNVSK